MLALVAIAADLLQPLAGHPGALVVMEVASGRVLAASHADRLARPGSVLKPFTLAALLETHSLDPQAPVPCRHRVRIGERHLDCTHVTTAGAMRAASALAYSCNFYFARMAAALHPADFARRLQPVARTHTAASPEELQLQALGEGDVFVTPLMLASAYRRLVLKLATTPSLEPVLEGLEGCTTYGTGQFARPEGLDVAGKTGTADSHAWFAGFAPARQPKIVVVVFLEHGQGGGDAAPIAREVFRRAFPPVPCAPPAYRVRLYWRNPPADPNVVRTLCMAPEDYVTAVLAGESSVFRSEEALKAMAVAARTYAWRFRGRHAKEGFDFCDTTHCQDLRLAARTERLARAVQDTESEMLWFEGAPAAAYYHRHCGGMTESDQHYPYLRQQADGYCLSRERGGWQATLSKEEIARALRLAGLGVAAGTPRLAILERSPSGRARTLLFGSLRIEASIFHAAIGQALGWDRLRSTLYEVRDSGASVNFQGRGFGHGLGLCQTGAAKMGEDGKPYRDILAYYYPGTTLGISARGFHWRSLGGERAEIWTSDPAAGAALPALADRMLEEAERRTGFRLAYRPRFQFYPTVASFRDATGEPGWVAAVSRGTVVRLQPAGVLRAAGTLSSTVLHESLHQLIESRARPGLPDWFREGLALFLSGPLPRPGNAQYRTARERVQRLVAQHGLATVLAWVASGLPPDAGPR